MKRVVFSGISAVFLMILALAAPAWASQAKASAAKPGQPDDSPAAAATRDLWQSVTADTAKIRALGAREAAVRPAAGSALRLNHDGMRTLLARAPLERSEAAKASPLVLDLPAPDGQFQRFVLTDSPVMEPGLAAKHPDIKTYRGHGVTDPTATIRADMTPLGFHASVRSTRGAWYIDPYYHLDTSLYVTYFGRDLKENPHGAFTEAELTSAEISVNHAYYHAPDPVTLHGTAFADNSTVTITITDPKGGARTVSTLADGLGGFDVVFDASASGNLGAYAVEASDGSGSATASYEVVSSEDASHDPPTGDVLRSYRLALITDPGYATFFGGPANVTAAKVTLMNRVVQIYEDDLSIHMNLVANNDLLNLDTWALAIGPNGPCGSAPCFSQSQVTGCASTTRARFVIGQIIGASNYDVGHLGLGQPGGGVANLGVVGRSNKAGGCTGIPTPVGDFYAVDYVAHEMGHQFSGNHP
ncbi:MAG TPA: M12 family metallo-peptidase, partial [Thermoanaerobaculia bacterium]|nr:M12 family metallo-peptidase [Thermoanaerobaculia bacterium]